MTKRLKRLETMYLDASPLTRLPGGVAIDNILRTRISDGAPFAFCLIDMDNFKAYSDYYGYAKGSEVIKATARSVEFVINDLGAEEDFVGHIGGDDFAVITVPERYKALAGAIIERFDREIPNLYAQEDRERGYIVAKSRQGQEMRYPMMTISIAVVTNQYHILTDPLQVGEIVAELKEYAKSIPKSIYVVDNRRAEGAQAVQNVNVIPFPQKNTKAAGE
jgi:diguanylate cyclase (GGDEF)-like protein